MSTNIFFKAIREVTVKKTGKRDLQVIEHEVWQTPTKVTYEIYESKDPVQAYVDWVLSESEDETVDVFDDDENYIGRQVVNFGKEHADEFLSWAATMEAEGYDIKPAVC